MISVSRPGLNGTQRLKDDQKQLAAVTDAGGPALVKDRGNSGYGSKAMRARLAAFQHEKCAYCEDRLRERAGEVDHVRPKDSYWWLAFSLDNLVAACRSCNNAKGNKFQLVRGAHLTPRQSPATTPEFPLLVDPTQDDPDLHLTYLFEFGAWRIAPLTDRGSWTIRELELDRDSFRIETNRYINDAVRPRAVAYFEALAAGDQQAAVKEIRAMRGLAPPDQPWTQLLRTVLAAVQAGEWS